MQGMLVQMQGVRSAVQSTKSKIVENKVAFRRLSSYIKVQTKKEKKVMTNTNIQNTISKVHANISSLFSKEDVIKLLTELDTEIRNEDPKPQIDKDVLLTTFRQMLSEKDWDNVVDKDDVELSIGYNNQIEIDRIAIDEDFLISETVDALEALLDVLEGEVD
jgi:cysteinyl-tRNA synthetase